MEALKNISMGKTLAGMALAFGAGLVTGLLTAPRTGRSARNWISQEGDHLEAQVKEKGRTIRRRANYEEGRLAGLVYKIKQLGTDFDRDKYVDDDLIAQRVRTRIGENKLTSRIPRINVDSGNGIVTLRGGVHTEEEKTNLEKVTCAVPDVEGVNNKVVVLTDRAAGSHEGS